MAAEIILKSKCRYGTIVIKTIKQEEEENEEKYKGSVLYFGIDAGNACDRMWKFGQ